MALARGRIAGELEGLGALVDGSAPPVDPACVPDPACVEAARVALPSQPAGLIVVELLRVGPVVQLTASAAGPAGGASGSHGLDPDQLASGPLLPPDVRAWASGLVPVLAPEPPPPPPPTPAPPLLSPLQTTAAVVAGAGAVVALVGVVLIVINAPVLEDPDSLRAEKEAAAPAGLVGIGAAVVGLALVGAGAAIFVSE